MNALNRIGTNAAFWLVAAGFYIWYVGREAGAYVDVLHVAIPLLGVAMATAWVFTSVLVPKYLLAGARGRFALYTAYTIIVSTYLVLAIIVADFMWSGFEVSQMTPAAMDRPALFLGVYVVVATATIFSLVGHWNELMETRQREVLEKVEAEERLRSALQRAEPEPLEVLVDREMLRIDPRTITHLEAAGDYVEIHADGKRLLTKARLGQLAERLAPAGFLRTHRSFVVRIQAVDRQSATEVGIAGRVVPIGRSYRARVREALNGSGDQQADPGAAN